MKRFTAVLAAAVLLACGCFAACGEDRNNILAAPDNLRIVDKVFVWNPVENATGYEVSVEDGSGRKTEECRYGLFYLQGTAPYTLKVKALGDLDHGDSDWAEISYDPTYVPEVVQQLFKYTLLEDGTGYAVERGVDYPIGNVVVPDEYNGLPVKTVSRFAFVDVETSEANYGGLPMTVINPIPNDEMTSLTLPAHLETIQAYALTACYTIKELILPETVKTVEAYAFSDCFSLDYVILPAGIENVDSSCVAGCTQGVKIFYYGSEEQWAKVNVVHSDIAQAIIWTLAGVTCYSDTEKAGCWHMVDGQPMLWE